MQELKYSNNKVIKKKIALWEKEMCGTKLLQNQL